MKNLLIRCGRKLCRINCFLPCILIMHLSQSTHAQQINNAEANLLVKQLQAGAANTTRVNTLITLSRYYLDKTLDPARDLDSALLLANQAADLSGRLKLTRQKENAQFLRGKIFIKQGNAVEVQQLLNRVSDSNHIKLLL